MQSAAKMQKRVWNHVFRVCLTKVRMYAPAIMGDSSSETNSSLLSAEREVNVPPAERTVSFMSRSPKKRTANERIDRAENICRGDVVTSLEVVFLCGIIRQQRNSTRDNGENDAYNERNGAASKMTDIRVKIHLHRDVVRSGDECGDDG